MSGCVVHAQGGNRTNYAPIRTSLCRGSDPCDVTSEFLDIFPFSSLYIADLDSILDRGNNRDAIVRIRSRFPSLELWVDSGITTLNDYFTWKELGLGRAILGSENYPEQNLFELGRIDHAILSLDFRLDQFLGPTNLDRKPADWPYDVIVMSLAKVGSKLGPDLERLTQLRHMAPDKNLIAAGGIHTRNDLDKLKNLGITNVLLATALHEGLIVRADIEYFSTDSGK
jgi:phosphoribosylformimino-5-aminoimidazole carboxamide ribotide isomerase